MPSFFLLLQMVASSFDPEAEKFMTVCTSKKAALAELRAIMDDDVIPVEYGGKNEEWYLKGAEKSLYDLVDNLNGKDPSTNDLERSRVRRVSAGRALKK